MFLRECKCTIVTLLSMLIYKHFALRFSRKVFVQEKQNVPGLKN